MTNKLAVVFAIICLSILSVSVLAQSIRDYVIADDAEYYFFDSRVISVPNSEYAVIFFNYVGQSDKITHIGSEYVKSAVINKKGKLGKATILAEAKWYYDGGVPPAAIKNYRSPRMVDVIWNPDREGFDIFMFASPVSDTTWSKPRKLFMLPLDNRGRPVGQMRKIRDFNGNRANDPYEDEIEFQDTWKFISGPDGQRLMLSRNTKTNNVRLHIFDKHGKKLLIRDNVLGNNTNLEARIPVALENYNSDSFFLYSEYYSESEGAWHFNVDVFDFNSLKQLSDKRSFSLTTSDFNNAMFAGNRHLLYRTYLNFGAQQYYAVFQTVGVKKKPVSVEKKLPIGKVLAVQPVADREGSDAYFNLFTIEERIPPDPDSIFLTRIDERGNTLSNPIKVFEIYVGSILWTLPYNYSITETANGNVLFVHNNRLFVGSSQ